jgi:hypothetical protein
MNLQPGDVFCVRTGGIGQAIRAVTRFWSKDGRTKHNHSGIVIGHNWETFEAKNRIGRFNLAAYIGRPVIIARPFVFPELIQPALDRVILQHSGQIYPWWRLPLHIVPWLARKVSYKGRYLVCSELNAKYLYHVGIRDRHFTGVNPDTLADEMKSGRYTILFNGILGA